MKPKEPKIIVLPPAPRPKWAKEYAFSSHTIKNLGRKRVNLQNQGRSK